MKVLSGVKQSGKTTKLLQEANGRDDVYVVSVTEFGADRMINYCEKNKLDVNIVSMKNLDGLPNGVEIWVDDFDLFLAKTFGTDKVRVAVNECEVEDLNEYDV